MSGSVVMAILLAGCAGAAMPASGISQLDRLRSTHNSPRTDRLSLGPRPPWQVVGWLAGLAVFALTGRLPVALTALLGALAALRAAGNRSSERRARARRERAVEVLGALAGELRGGAPARVALAAASGPVLPEVAAALRSPATDPADALAAIGSSAGYELLADLAVAWRLAEGGGASLVGPLASLTAAARADEAVRRELAAQLAGPRATALLLAGLPVAGVLLGTALGADPLDFLLGTQGGNLCLLAGTVLVAVGLRWTEAIAAAAERP